MLKKWNEYRIIKNSGFFDPAYYLLSNPGVRKADIDPLTHFIEHGWREGRNPSQKFDTKYYLETKMDVNKEEINPLYHYLKHGREEEQAPCKDCEIEVLTAQEVEKDLSLIRASGFFDEAWYLEHNSDVTRSGIAPASHYLLFGGFEGCDPSHGFNSNWYLRNYRDVKLSGINPLIHYLRYGKRECRLPQPCGNNQNYIVSFVRRGIRYLKQEGIKSFLQKIIHKSISKTTRDDYIKWIHQNEPGFRELKNQRKESETFNTPPLISVVIPVYNPPIKILSETIYSVMVQTYPNWELCIVNGDPKNINVTRYLEKAKKRDSRIKVEFLNSNLGIAQNTNEAINMTQGEFVAFLDHDDVLAPFALFEVVKEILNDDDIDLIYSDEDKLLENSNRRYDPYFKPGYSIDLLRASNYMTHFLVVKKEIGDEVGWLRTGFDGSQDHDLILRVVEKARKIFHISKILYHWRAIPGSAALDANAKSYASDAGLKAVQQHLERQGIKAVVKKAEIPHTYQTSYLYEDWPLISIIIPTRDQHQLLQNCVNSILAKSSYRKYEIILIENHSLEADTFKTYKELSNDPRIKIIQWDDKPFNYSIINNYGVDYANGELLLFLNNDIEIISSDWLEALAEYALRKDVGIVGAKLYYPNDTIQHAGVVIGMGGIAGHPFLGFERSSSGHFGLLKLPYNVSAVTGACMMIKKSVFKEIGGFDPNYPLAFGDVDICLKSLNKGYLNVWTPFSEMYHYESFTRGLDDTPEKNTRFQEEIRYFKTKWPSDLQKCDYYYNPNLTLDKFDYSIK